MTVPLITYILYIILEHPPGSFQVGLRLHHRPQPAGRVDVGAGGEFDAGLVDVDLRGHVGLDCLLGAFYVGFSLGDVAHFLLVAWLVIVYMMGWLFDFYLLLLGCYLLYRWMNLLVVT